MNQKKNRNIAVIVTGCAGFIGFHLTKYLLELGIPVFGVDNINSYYDVSLKKARLQVLEKESIKFSVPFEFYKIDIEDFESLDKVFKSSSNFNKYLTDNHQIKVVNLAAQAGVRYSIENPFAYIQSNLVGFINVLELCKKYQIDHLVYASSSSVYGGNTNLPFNEKNSVDHPVSLYAATKKSNELMAHSYSHLYGLPTTGLRFFTVYGPWGRPDMALFLFTKAIIEKKPIKVFNNGNMVRDFTYIQDIVKSLVKVIFKNPKLNSNFDSDNPLPNSSWAPYKIFNIGNSNAVKLMDYVEALEKELGIKAEKIFMNMQPGDVAATISDTNSLEEWIGFKPNTSIEKGIKEFVKWYKDFYGYK